MLALKIIAVLLGLAFTLFRYFIYFRKKYNLIDGFNLWTDGYDLTVGLSNEENTYPFAGYKAILSSIFQNIMEKLSAVVFDIGFGTGTLTTSARSSAVFTTTAFW